MSAYKSLVESGIISEQEFWQAQTDEVLGEYTVPETDIEQEKGLESSIPSTTLESILEKAALEGNRLKLNLTSELTQAVFIDYPAVERAFKEMVPSKISKEQFWQSFIKAQYLHHLKSRSNDLAGQMKFNRLIVDQNLEPFVRLTQTEDSNVYKESLREKRDQLIDSYNIEGLDKDIPKTNEEVDTEQDKEKIRRKNQDLIRKLNRHGSLILDINDAPQQNTVTLRDKVKPLRSEVIRRQFEDTLLVDHKELRAKKKTAKPKTKQQSLESSNSKVVSANINSFIDRIRELNILDIEVKWKVPSKPFKLKRGHSDETQLEHLKSHYKVELFEIEQWLKHFWIHHNIHNLHKLEQIHPKLVNALHFLKSIAASQGDDGKELLSIHGPPITHAIELYQELKESSIKVPND